MTLNEVFNRNVPGEYYASPKGWFIRTEGEGDGTFIDPKNNIVKWTGHNGSELDPSILASPVEKMQYLRKN